MTYYHATTEEGYKGITKDGVIRKGWDDVVYLCEHKEDCIKFLAFRRFNEPIYVFEVEIPEKDKDKIIESFDHSYEFFKCRAWMYDGNIPYDWVTNCWKCL